MKIHTKVVIDIASGAVLDDQWFEYAGPVALADGGDSPPGPSEEERALQAEQAETLRLERTMLERQLATQDLLAPFLYEELGLIPTYGATPSWTEANQAEFDALNSRLESMQAHPAVQSYQRGGFYGRPGSEGDRAVQEFLTLQEQFNALDARRAESQQSAPITGFEEIPPTEAELLRDQIELGLLQRSQRALEGKLPVSPTLEREIAEQGETLRARLRRNLGPGFETSSPGIESLAELDARATEAREAARRGELTLSEQLSLARGGQNFQMGQATRAELSGLPAMHPSFANVIAGYNAPLNRMMEDRYARFQIEASQPSFGSTLGQFLGVAGGYFAGGLGAAAGQKLGTAIAT